MKFRENQSCEENCYGQTPAAFISESDATPQKIHETLWSAGYGGQGYKFAVIFDVSHDEYEPAPKETQLYFLDDILNEVCEYAGVEFVKSWLRQKGCEVK